MADDRPVPQIHGCPMKTVLLLSGGIDSTTLLWKLAHDGDTVACLSVDYGQRHIRELDHCTDILDEAICVDVQDHFMHQVVSIRGICGSALVGDGDIPHHDDPQSATVVPGRNLMFIAAAAGWAQEIGYDRVALGCHSGDHAIYRDCRIDFIAAADIACQMGYGVSVVAPFSRMNKRDIVQLAAELNTPIGLTWTCYEGGDDPCGECGACRERNQAIGRIPS